MKLFTIGDSISQGFMSLAAARADLCYSTLIARSMGMIIGSDYHYPEWSAGGLPAIFANLEKLLRRLDEKYRSDINAFDGLTLPIVIEQVLNEAERYYERDKGNSDEPYSGGVEFFHNVAIQGFDVADSWMVTPKVCRKQILSSNQAGEGKDNLFAAPNAAFYRTALKVLNPSLKPEYDNFSQLEWLKKHATNPQEGVENLFLWLGANNALGTVISLRINQTPNDPSETLTQPSKNPQTFREVREAWNLWHPNDFEAEYKELLERVDEIMQANSNPNWNVFIGTVPLVTIAPLAKGVGPTTEIEIPGEERPAIYYKYYTYFPLEEDTVRKTDGAYLTLQDALHIDDCIRKYNQIITKLVASKNSRYEKNHYHIVDICKALQDIAYKRNAGKPQYKFPDYFDFVYPQVNTKYYHADITGRLRQGGLVSLDGIHPSAIGHGLIAYEFLKKMKSVGVVSSTDLNWKEIFNKDDLYQKPIPIMHEFYEHEKLAECIIKLITRNLAASQLAKKATATSKLSTLLDGLAIAKS